MKILFIPLIALGFGTAAMAQAPDSTPKSYPPCSKSVTDECMSSSHAAPMAHHKAAAHHHAKWASHHHGMAHAAKPAMKKAETKPS
ncbi:hypothetical protein [Sphingobium sp. Sx8-8]|uniref:hypothetical protein n=1 Tax=Sphingobium sp. Sx8-8 TaxID=2933617 RepID=UPI001F5978B4|nr:hypothetical protein [Sphingobium sp. Sx8-8]